MNITIIGLGEAGSIIAEDLQKNGAAVRVWDCQPQGMREKATRLSVQWAASFQAAVAEANWVISLVTASESYLVAQKAARFLRPGQTFIDCNSVSPNTRQALAEVINQTGADYLEAAVMAPVPPARLATPILLGGRNARSLQAPLTALGFNCQVYSDEVGKASAIKMCRSIMIKGLEALTTECLTAAQSYAVAPAVLASLHQRFPSLGWDQTLPDYLISRVAEHGLRRSEEMLEVAKMLQDIGQPATMSLAIADTQQSLVKKLAQHSLHYRDLVPFNWLTIWEKLHD